MAKKQDLKITRRKPKAGRDPGTKELPPSWRVCPRFRNRSWNRFSCRQKSGSTGTR